MVDILTKRQIKILEILCKSRMGCSSNTLSEILVVSTRTIRSDINKINSYLSEVGCNINASNKRGYFLDLSDIDIVRNIISEAQNQKNNELPIVSVERQHYLLGKIIFEKEINLITFSDSIFVSLNTVLKDLEKLEKNIIEKYSLDIFKLKGNYLHLKSDEYSLRKLLFKIAKNEITFSSQLISENLKFLIGNHLDINMLLGIKKNVSHFYSSRKFLLSDESLFSITWILYFTMYRSERIFKLTCEISYKPYKFNEIVNDLLKFIEKEEDIKFSQDELDMLMNYIDTITLIDTNNITQIISTEAETIIKDFISSAFEVYSINLSTNKELLRNMSIHIDAMIKKIYANYELDNPAIHLIKLNYPYSYSIATLISEIVYRTISHHISDDDIAYVALYVESIIQSQQRKVKTILVSSTGLAMLNLLKVWIENNFSKQIEIINYLPSHMVESYIKDNETDLIISTADLRNTFNIQAVKMNPIPLKEDYEKVRTIIKRKFFKNNISNIINSVFNTKLVRIVREKTNFEAAIRNSAERFKSIGIIEDSEAYVKDTLNREKIYPTFLTNNFMMPHPINTFSTRTCISVTILNTPIIINEKEIKLIFALALDGKQNPNIDIIFEMIHEIGSSIELFKDLIKIEQSEYFIKALTDIYLDIN